MSAAESQLKKVLKDNKDLKVKIGWYCDKKPVIYHKGIVLELDGKKRINKITKKVIPWPKYTVDFGTQGGKDLFLAGNAGVDVYDYNEDEIGEKEILCTITSTQFQDGDYVERWKEYQRYIPTYQALLNNCRDFTNHGLELLRRDGHIKSRIPFKPPAIPLEGWQVQPY